MAHVKHEDFNDKLPRREWLRKIVSGGLYLSFAQEDLARLLAAVPGAQGGKLIQQTPFSPDDEAFLEELEHANFLFFSGANQSRNGHGSRPLQHTHAGQLSA